MFKCKTCVSKDQHIADLQKTIEFLKMQLSPQVQALPTVNLEANYMLDGGSREEINVETMDQLKERAKIDAEATAILSGDYEDLEISGI